MTTDVGDTGAGPSPRPFDNILNCRDVGAKVNSFCGSNLHLAHCRRMMLEGRLYRSARPDSASPEDRRRLVDEYGIRTIIDLRTKSEHIKQAQKSNPDLHSTAIVPQSNNTTAETLKIAGIQYHEVNLNGGAFERALLWKLSWLSLTRLLILMAFGRRSEAISILGREVMQPRGLVGLGKDSIDHCWVELREILQIFADSSNYPVMVHCTQGKDRTGLVVIILLLMLDIPLDAITYDYVASEAELCSDKEARMQEISALGLTEDFAGTPSDFVTQICQHIHNTYEGLQLYLERIGLRAELREKIKSICLYL